MGLGPRSDTCVLRARPGCERKFLVVRRANFGQNSAVALYTLKQPVPGDSTRSFTRQLTMSATTTIKPEKRFPKTQQVLAQSQSSRRPRLLPARRIARMGTRPTVFP